MLVLGYLRTSEVKQSLLKIMMKSTIIFDRYNLRCSSQFTINRLLLLRDNYSESFHNNIYVNINNMLIPMKSMINANEYFD